MFYPEKGKKYTKIRKNYVDYREENRKKEIRKTVIVAIIAVAAVAVAGFVGYYYGFWQDVYEYIVMSF